MGSDPKSQYAFGESSNQRKAFAGRSLDRDLLFLKPLLRPGMRVADCGCGAGGLSLQIAQLVAPGLVFGFDQSPAAIDQALTQAGSAGLSNVRFSRASVYGSGLEAATFDVVLFSGVLAHLAEPKRALRHAHELLKPGGVIAAIEPQKQGDWFGGKGSGAMSEINRMYISDIAEAGGDPFIGLTLKRLFQEVGFVDVAFTPGYSPALSTVEVAGGAFANRVSEASFVEKTVRRGSHTENDMRRLAAEVELWRADPASVVGLCECSALGYKRVG